MQVFTGDTEECVFLGGKGFGGVSGGFNVLCVFGAKNLSVLGDK